MCVCVVVCCWWFAFFPSFFTTGWSLCGCVLITLHCYGLPRDPMFGSCTLFFKRIKKKGGRRYFYSHVHTLIHTHTQITIREKCLTQHPFIPFFCLLFHQFFIFGYAFLCCSHNFTILLACIYILCFVEEVQGLK